MVNLVEEKASTVGEWCDIIARIAPWKTEAECQAFWIVSAKVRSNGDLGGLAGRAGTWDVAMFDSRYAHWQTIWLHCREHGIEFEEARKAFLRGELKEFIVSKGTLETVAA